MKYRRIVGSLLAALTLTIAGCRADEDVYWFPKPLEGNPWTHREFAAAPADFQFAIVSDRTGGRRPGVFATAVEKLNLLQPEFVICVGDLIDGYSEDVAELDAQWGEFDAMVAALDMPFFYVPGNHDIGNRVMEAKWIERRGRPYYHFVYKNVLFLCLNSEDPPATHVSDRQIAYVRDALKARPRVRWTFVFLHRPMWSFSEAQKAETGWAKIEQMLEGRPHTIFTGHYHKYLHVPDERGDRFILSVTGGGSSLSGPEFGNFDHVVWITMGAEGPKIANLALDGIHAKDVHTVEKREHLAALFGGSGASVGPIFATGDAFGGAKTTLHLANGADAPMTARVLFRAGGRVRITPTGVHQVVAAGTATDVPLSIECDAPIPVDDLAPMQMEWSISYERQVGPPLRQSSVSGLGVARLRSCTPRESPVRVDGRLDEWKDLPHVCRQPAQIAGPKKQWTGPEDCSFRFAVEHDREHLYIALRTVDDATVLAPGRKPWQQDGVQIHLDARPEPDRSLNARREAFKDFLPLNFCAGEGGQAVIDLAERLPEGVRIACVRAEGGTAAEIAIPASYLDRMQGGAWKAVRLSVGVYDRDTPEDKFLQVLWRPKWSGGGCPGSGTFRRE
jgi:hypothetical protein